MKSARIAVVESNGTGVNQWLAFECDVAAEFRAAFGEEPLTISAVAVASGADITGASVISFLWGYFPS